MSATPPHLTATNHVDHSNWKGTILDIWRIHSGRAPTALDVNNLRLVLDAPETFIRQTLANLVSCWPTPPSIAPQVSGSCEPPPFIDHTSRHRLSEIGHHADEVVATQHPQCVLRPSVQNPRALQQLTNDKLALKSLPLRPHHENSEPRIPSQILAKPPREPQWGPADMPVPPATLAAIKNDIQKRKQHGCSIVSHVLLSEEGFPCTLGCGRWLASSCDRRRHEQTVFPREYWACYSCPSGSTSRRQFKFFHRLDKIQKHNREVHDGQLDINDCKIRDLPVLTPASCALCRDEFTDSEDRDGHIERCHPGRKAQTHDGAQASIPVMHTGSGVQTPLIHVRRAGPDIVGNAPDGVAQSPEPPFCTVRLYRLLTKSSKGILTQTEYPIGIQWLEEAETRCGVAVTLPVNIAFDMRLHCVSEPRPYTVKRYSHQYKDLWERELSMYSELALRSENSGLMDCFGYFHSRDHNGMSTYNILLDGSHSTLWKHWAQNDPPRTFKGIHSFYTELFSLAVGIESLQRLRGTIDQGTDCVLRGDLRPESIHTFPQPQDEVAGKIRLNMLYQSCANTRPESSAGRRAWRRAFIVLIWFGCNSKLDLVCSTASNGLDYGKYVSETYRTVLIMVDTVQESANGRIDNSLEKVRRADVLAFSCVLTLAATWIAMGREGLLALEQKPLPRVQVEQPPLASSPECPVDIAAVPTVSRWHMHLRNFISQEDTVTLQLLDFLDQCVFRTQSAHLVHTSDLKTALGGILDRAYHGWRCSPVRVANVRYKSGSGVRCREEMN